MMFSQMSVGNLGLMGYSPPMSLSLDQVEGTKYFAEKYEIIRDLPLVAEKKIILSDSNDKSVRVCRFCGLSKPAVTFHRKAHAISEFFGNKSILSQNECDTCNEYLAQHCEDDLSKWFGPLRAATRMKGKGGMPTYKADGIRIEEGPHGISISVTKPIGDMGISEDGPFTFTLPVATPSQPFIPINAAKALVKMACSLVSPSELKECKQAIDWVRGRMVAKMSRFPVLFAFTPGANPYVIGKALVLRRKVNEPIPYLYCIIASSNVRFQFFVPFCPSDMPPDKKEVTFSLRHFPFPFGDDWPHGKTKFGMLNWAGQESIVVTPEVSFHVEKAVRQNSPEK